MLGILIYSNIFIDSPYLKRGCWKDDLPRALTDIDSQIEANYNYKSRELAIQKCLEAAKTGGYKVFAIQDGGQCFASMSLTSYRVYGGSTQCLDDGKGGPMSNEVYEIRNSKLQIILHLNVTC